MRPNTRIRPQRWHQSGAVAIFMLAAALPLHARIPREQRTPVPAAYRLAEEKAGSLSTHDGLRLRLSADVGNVRIFTDSSNQVRYRVRIEADSRLPGAQELLRGYSLRAQTTPFGVQLTGTSPARLFRGSDGPAWVSLAPRLWVSFEVHVPRHYNLDVNTQAGTIDVQDIDGRVAVVTGGGNITAGRIGGATAGASELPSGPVARLETQGGHILVGDVRGDLRAVTAGGHITAGNIAGDAVLRSGGGHLHVGAIGGTADLATTGGNIIVQRSGASVSAATGGGQIEFGEAAGSIRARTAGGGIRIVRVSGPTELASSGGSIFLTGVEGPLRATTGSGSITAWFTSEGAKPAARAPRLQRLAPASQLESGQGDIVVYLPRELAATIQATIQNAAGYHIEADPSLAIKYNYGEAGAGSAVRGECALNGGGEVLKLKTNAGNIRVKFIDSNALERLNQLQVERLERRMQLQQKHLLELEQVSERAAEEMIGQQGKSTQQLAERIAAEQRQKAEEAARQMSRMAELTQRLEEFWWGGVHVDPSVQQQKRVYAVAPAYPDVARQAGIEGTVVLRALIGRDGTVQYLKVLSGNSVLAQAATEVVRQWRYQPTIVDGKPVNVVTTVAVEFRLH